MRQQERTVGGRPARWLEHGAGRPVVLVHGIPTSPELWRHVVPLVQGRSLAWEMPGYGRSITDGQGLDLSLSSQADRLLAWVEALGLDRPVLVGHDLGGGVAQIAASRQPGRFGALVLTNAVCYDSWPIPSVLLMQRMAPALRHLPAAALYPAFAQLVLRGHDSLHTGRQSLRLHWQHYRAQGAAAALMRQVTALDAGDTLAVAPDLPRLRLPARVVWGEADGFQKARYGRRLAEDLGAGYLAIPGGRHFTPEDHPEVLAAAVNEVLAESA